MAVSDLKPFLEVRPVASRWLLLNYLNFDLIMQYLRKTERERERQRDRERFKSRYIKLC